MFLLLDIPEEGGEWSGYLKTKQNKTNHHSLKLESGQIMLCSHLKEKGPCTDTCKSNSQMILFLQLKLFLCGESHTFSNIFTPKLLYQHLDHSQVAV